jgi:lysophospholipase L1-like esterase
VLGSTTVERFERDLDALLNQTSQRGVRVVMFELPIPPLLNGYGRVQRQLAARYGAALIPKRILASVIAGKGSTIDSLHLSAEGHRAMADAVWQVLAPAYERE